MPAPSLLRLFYGVTISSTTLSRFHLRGLLFSQCPGPFLVYLPIEPCPPALLTSPERTLLVSSASERSSPFFLFVVMQRSRFCFFDSYDSLNLKAPCFPPTPRRHWFCTLVLCPRIFYLLTASPDSRSSGKHPLFCFSLLDFLQAFSSLKKPVPIIGFPGDLYFFLRIIRTS